MISIVENNPFRILGVYSDTPLKYVIANANKIKAFVKIGKSVPMETDKINGFTSSPARTAETVDDALALLQSEADKAKYALFWFNNSGINFGTEKLIKDDVEGAAAQFMSAIESNDISLIQNVIGDKTNSFTTEDLLKCYVGVLTEQGLADPAISGCTKTSRKNVHRDILASLHKGGIIETLKDYTDSVSNLSTDNLDKAIESLKRIVGEVNELIAGKNLSDISLTGAYDKFCKEVRGTVVSVANKAIDNIGTMTKENYSAVKRACLDILKYLNTEQTSIGTATKINEDINTLTEQLNNIGDTYRYAIAANEDICWYCGEKATHEIEKKYQRKEERQISYNTKQVTTYTRSVKLHVCDKCQHENDVTQGWKVFGIIIMVLIEYIIAFLCVKEEQAIAALFIVGFGNCLLWGITGYFGGLLGRGIRWILQTPFGIKPRKFIRKDNDHPLIRKIKRDGFS